MPLAQRPSSISPRQLRQPGEVRGHPPGLVADQQWQLWPPGRPLLPLVHLCALFDAGNYVRGQRLATRRMDFAG